MNANQEKYSSEDNKSVKKRYVKIKNTENSDLKSRKKVEFLEVEVVIV